ncbi:ABC transporter ATP-binding protein [Amycolatopsis circi]|uniref:ABC transporter ATP-binding protein n=1 Tax=Amycolatopsis circi TaxID=871959 RepID=UPI000E26D949|nr:ATP-binding cassette domain-containing protein [Amycolatopsis circi]
MNTPSVIVTEKLSKVYSKSQRAVDDLGLNIRSGEVYGFLGLNGAGKTTTMRMLAGLVRPTAGSITVLGKPPGFPATLAKLGCLIEAPAFYPFLSGTANLKLLARYSGRSAKTVPVLLERVGLEAKRTPFRAYSLGMKQRLGVAAALLKEPELLILDEPTNGLDPAGMAAMRDLIRSLQDEGRTIMLSSHLLAEVEAVCDRIGIIREGRLVVEGTVGDLRRDGTTPQTVIKATPQDDALAILAAMQSVRDLRVTNGEIRFRSDGAELGAISSKLALGGVQVTELRQEERSLEAIFMELATGTSEQVSIEQSERPA